ncbi:MAG: hypothetical protein ACTSV7_14575 [Candidatus Baldrarchaeia archaeon]
MVSIIVMFVALLTVLLFLVFGYHTGALVKTRHVRGHAPYIWLCVILIFSYGFLLPEIHAIFSSFIVQMLTYITFISGAIMGYVLE